MIKFLYNFLYIVYKKYTVKKKYCEEEKSSQMLFKIVLSKLLYVNSENKKEGTQL